MNDRMNKELNKINEMKVVKNIEEKKTEVEDLLSIKLLFFWCYFWQRFESDHSW